MTGTIENPVLGMALESFKIGPKEASSSWADTALPVGLSIGLTCLGVFSFRRRFADLVATRLGGRLSFLAEDLSALVRRMRRLPAADLEADLSRLKEELGVPVWSHRLDPAAPLTNSEGTDLISLIRQVVTKEKQLYLGQGHHLPTVTIHQDGTNFDIAFNQMSARIAPMSGGEVVSDSILMRHGWQLLSNRRGRFVRYYLRLRPARTDFAVQTGVDPERWEAARRFFEQHKDKIYGASVVSQLDSMRAQRIIPTEKWLWQEMERLADDAAAVLRKLRESVPSIQPDSPQEAIDRFASPAANALSRIRMELRRARDIHIQYQMEERSLRAEAWSTGLLLEGTYDLGALAVELDNFRLVKALEVRPGFLESVRHQLEVSETTLGFYRERPRWKEAVRFLSQRFGEERVRVSDEWFSHPLTVEMEQDLALMVRAYARRTLLISSLNGLDDAALVVRNSGTHLMLLDNAGSPRDYLHTLKSMGREIGASLDELIEAICYHRHWSLVQEPWMTTRGGSGTEQIVLGTVSHLKVG